MAFSKSETGHCLLIKEHVCVFDRVEMRVMAVPLRVYLVKVTVWWCVCSVPAERRFSGFSTPAEAQFLEQSSSPEDTKPCRPAPGQWRPPQGLLHFGRTSVFLRLSPTEPQWLCFFHKKPLCISGSFLYARYSLYMTDPSSHCPCLWDWQTFGLLCAAVHFGYRPPPSQSFHKEAPGTQSPSNAHHE